MTFRSEFSGLRQRLADFTARFEEKRPNSGTEKASSAPFGLLRSIYFNLRNLFTQDVTREGLRDLLKRDPRETFRYFTQGIDFTSFGPFPWYKRYPAMVGKIFLAMAYRLSPPRRIAFAIGTFLFIIGWAKFVFTPNGSGVRWWFVSIVILVLLLFMELRDKLDLKGDLEIAREIQFGLVPSQPFQEGGITIHCVMRPANTVGGDYYDIIELSEANHIGVVVGDVAGKGMPAALLMALLQGSLRTLITAGFRGPELITKLNAYLCGSIPENSLVTLFFGELNLATGDLCYVNAGHNAPFLIGDSRTLKRLSSTSIVLGITKESRFEASETRLEEGERLLLFTDGVSEAFNPKGEEYGEARLGEFLQNHMNLTQSQLIQELIDDVLAFCGDARPSDDMTLMSIGRQSVKS